jgi:hypothetical protein
MDILITLYIISWVAVPVGLAWTIWTWWRSSPKVESPKWRSYLGLTAFSLAGISALLFLFLAIWARVRGGFPFYDPVVLRCYRVGFILGAGGFTLSLLGNGKVRWPACVISFAMMFMWLVAAAGE